MDYLANIFGGYFIAFVIICAIIFLVKFTVLCWFIYTLSDMRKNLELLKNKFVDTEK